MGPEKVISISDVGFRRLSHSPFTGRAFNKAPPQQAAFPGQRGLLGLRLTGSKNIPVRKETQALQDLPICICALLAYEAVAVFVLNGLERRNAFSRKSFKGDTTPS